MPAYALIVEPDPVQAQLYRHLVVAEGFEAKLARDGEQALATLRSSGAPALTITELSLAQTDGFALIGEIRKLASEEHSPVVVISAFRALRDTAVKLREELGISALLARSAPIDSISKALKRVLASSAAPHGPKPSPAGGRHAAASGAEVDEERAEELRLHHLDEMDLVEDAAATQDDELREIVEAAAKQFHVSMAAISLVLEDELFFKAHVGFGPELSQKRGVPRDLSFCTHVVQGRRPLFIPDAAVHPSFSQNPMVQDGSLRSYAGAPLETPDGHVLGTLCLFDSRPMALSADDLDELVVLARHVAGELELRASRKRHDAEQKRLQPEVARRITTDKPLYTALSYLSAVLENIDNGVFLLDGERRIVFANHALSEILGIEREHLLGKSRDELVREAAQLSTNPEDFLRRMRTASTGPYALRGEFELERPRRRLIRWTAKPVQLGEGVGHLGVLTDITAETELVHEREQLARIDPVTGLVNRRGGEEVLQREASRAQRFGSRVSVALVDLDHFKQVNDRHGHGAGDEALRAVGQVIAAAMRGVDVPVRWGGDELLAILPATGLEGAKSFAERIRAQVEGLGEQVMHGSTLSVGVAELQPGEDWADAVRRADAKLYEAKDAGRNRVA